PALAEVEPPAADGEVDDEGGAWLSWDWPSIPRPLLITAAGFAVLGTAVIFVSRAYRAGLLRVPVMKRSAGRTGDAGRVTLVARAVASAIAAEGHTEARLVLVRED